MSRPTVHGRRWAPGLRLAAALLLCTLFDATCKVNAPGVSVNMDDHNLDLEAPGVTVHIEPGRAQVNVLPGRYHFEP